MLKAALLTAIRCSFVAWFWLDVKSHQAKVDRFQKEYDRLAAVHQDCSAEYLKVPPTLSPKCNDENNKVKAAWDRLQAERAKQ